MTDIEENKNFVSLSDETKLNDETTQDLNDALYYLIKIPSTIDINDILISNEIKSELMNNNDINTDNDIETEFITKDCLIKFGCILNGFILLFVIIIGLIHEYNKYNNIYVIPILSVILLGIYLGYLWISIYLFDNYDNELYSIKSINYINTFINEIKHIYPDIWMYLRVSMLVDKKYLNKINNKEYKTVNNDENDDDIELQYKSNESNIINNNDSSDNNTVTKQTKKRIKKLKKEQKKQFKRTGKENDASLVSMIDKIKSQFGYNKCDDLSQKWDLFDDNNMTFNVMLLNITHNISFKNKQSKLHYLNKRSQFIHENTILKDIGEDGVGIYQTVLHYNINNIPYNICSDNKNIKFLIINNNRNIIKYIFNPISYIIFTLFGGFFIYIAILKYNVSVSKNYTINKEITTN